MPLYDEKTRVSQISKIGEKVSDDRDACLIQIHGNAMGRKFPIDKEVVTIGRGPDNDVVCDMDNVSRAHAKVIRRDDGIYIEDLGSTNGTFVNDEEVHVHRLRNGDLIKIGGTIFKYLSGGNVEAMYYEEIYRMTIIDGLTMIYNKRYFMEFLEREMARCSRYKSPLSLIMFDLDHFKRINDEYGHLAGDFVLKKVSADISRRIRKEECFARYGGEEFAIVLPDTPLERARILAEKIRALVEASTYEFENSVIPVTLSVGVAQMRPEHREPEQFIKAADEKLYAAKAAGRNCVQY